MVQCMADNFNFFSWKEILLRGFSLTSNDLGEAQFTGKLRDKRRTQPVRGVVNAFSQATVNRGGVLFPGHLLSSKLLFVTLSLICNI